MIITSSDRPSDSKLQAGELKLNPEEPPPSYSESKAGGQSSTPSSTFKTKPTNFLALFNENDTIRGEFAIDPAMRIPTSMLPPLAENEIEADRKNLSLRSKNGSVHANIWLLGPSSDSIPDDCKPRRATFSLTSAHGSISAQMQTFDGAVPFSLTACSAHGRVRLALPRSFQGLLSVSTRHGSISVCDALVQNATQFSQVDTTRRYFIGDIRLLGEDAWQGDQVEVEAPHGSIHIKYVDEVEATKGKKSLLNRLLGK